jgi:phenylpyruvate tautomerase PptA (4-oxalocrotonate tautomerase family)
MPLVRIEIIRGRSLAERKRLLDGVHDALVEAFGTPDDDRTQRMIEHNPENFEIPPGAGERFTLIEITAFPREMSNRETAPLPGLGSQPRRGWRSCQRHLGRSTRAAHGELGHQGRETSQRSGPRLPRGDLTPSP